MNSPKNNTKQAQTHNSAELSKSSGRPRIEVSAGGIVYKHTRQGIVVGMLMDAYGKWTFAKGHVRRGESLLEAAARECWEEMGLSDLTVVRKLGRIDIWFVDRYVHKGRLIHKFITYFLFEAPPTARIRKPRVREEGERIQDVSWVPLVELMQRSAYPDLEPILKNALGVIRRFKRGAILASYESHSA